MLRLKPPGSAHPPQRRGIGLLLAGAWLAASLTSCSLVRMATGTDVDMNQFALARQAKMLDVRAKAAEDLQARLQKGDPLANADMVTYLTEPMLNKMLGELRGVTGMVDKSQSYEIDSIRVDLVNGSAIATVLLHVKNNDGIEARLTLDCALDLQPADSTLKVRFVPFNIAPDVKSGGWLPLKNDIIRDAIALGLTRFTDTMKPWVIPLSQRSSFGIVSADQQVRGPLNLNVHAPKRVVSYRMTMSEVLVFDGVVMMVFRMTEVKVL
jgi:hypothetical protein